MAKVNQHRHARQEAKRARRARRNGIAGPRRKGSVGRRARAGHGPLARAIRRAGLVKAGEDIMLGRGKR